MARARPRLIRRREAETPARRPKESTMFCAGYRRRLSRHGQSLRHEMTIRFKIIHFVPDPFSGARVPVGVVARRANGDVELITPGRLPSAACLGSESAHASLALLMEDLRKVDSFDVDVSDIGPHLVSTDDKSIAIREGDVESWFRKTLFPRDIDHEPRKRSQGGTPRLGAPDRGRYRPRRARGVHRTNQRGRGPEPTAAVRRRAGWYGASGDRPDHAFGVAADVARSFRHVARRVPGSF